MNAFFEKLLRDHPEQCHEMRQWLRSHLFTPGGVVPTIRISRKENKENEIASTPLPPWSTIGFPHEEVAHSEDEMLKPDRLAGDRVFRVDLDQMFLFIGGNPLDPDRYFRLMTLCDGVYGVGGYSHQLTRVPSELLSPSGTHDASALPKSLHLNQGECKFYSTTSELRCAVNPCAKTCEGCIEFEPKSRGF
jgi:hypothetical protein